MVLINIKLASHKSTLKYKFSDITCIILIIDIVIVSMIISKKLPSLIFFLINADAL